MTITTYDICKNLITAIERYRPLKYFCRNKFKKQPKIFFEIDENNPPANEDVPIIALYQGSIDYSEPTAAKRTITFACAIKDDDVDKSVGEGMYKGYRTVETLETLIYNAIDKYIDERLRDMSIIDVGSTGVKQYYPFFHSTRVLEIITRR